jgi:hypothetical protein
MTIRYYIEVKDDTGQIMDWWSVDAKVDETDTPEEQAAAALSALTLELTEGGILK